jgi:hypothetical protein
MDAAVLGGIIGGGIIVICYGASRICELFKKPERLHLMIKQPSHWKVKMLFSQLKKPIILKNLNP